MNREAKPIREARAIIRWIASDRGGRAAPPAPAVGYSAPVELGGGWWSVKIIEAVELNGPDVLEVRVKFVSDDAPHHLLTDGTRLDLFEGRRHVARAIVLPDDVTVPDQLSDFELALLA